MNTERQKASYNNFLQVVKVRFPNIHNAPNYISIGQYIRLFKEYPGAENKNLVLECLQELNGLENICRTRSIYSYIVDLLSKKKNLKVIIPPKPTEDMLNNDAIQGAKNLYDQGLLSWKYIAVEIYDAAAKMNHWVPNHYTQFYAEVRRQMILELDAKMLVEPLRALELEAAKVKILQGHWQDRIDELCKKWSVKILFDQQNKYTS